MKTVLEKHKSLDSGKLTDIVTNYKAHALPEMTPSPFKSKKKIFLQSILSPSCYKIVKII